MKMNGFFDEQFDKSEELANCEECGMYKTVQSPKMEPVGKGKRRIMVIGEGPGKTEDEEGEQWVGKAGNLLQEYLSEFGIDLRRDCIKHNAVACRPIDDKGGNRTPTSREIVLCHRNVTNAIKEHSPTSILLMGGSAIESFFMDDPIASSFNISLLRGRAIPYHKYNCWVFPMFHPSYILRNDNKKTRRLFYKDLKHATDIVGSPLPDISFINNYKILTDKDKIIALLEKILKYKPKIVFDYETNAKSPYRENPKVRCISLQDVTSDTAYSFPYQYQNTDIPPKRITELWRDILSDPEIKKVGQNIKFESHWSKAVFDVQVKGWVWDTMVNTHILEGPTIGGLSGVNGLKEQAFLRWGIIGYEDEIEPYMKKVDRTGENYLHNAPLEMLLKYSAMDSLVTTKLYLAQKKEFDPFLTQGRKFLQRGLTALYKIEYKGVNVDEEYYEKEDARLTRLAEKLERQLLEEKEALKFKKKFGRQIKLTSSDDLRDLFYNILKMKPIKFTDTTKDYEDEADRTASVDKSVMAEIDNPFAAKIVSYRKVLKLRDTYLAQFQRFAYNGKLHPTNNLHITRTYRSSVSNPNSQNIPNRDPEAEKSTRRGVIPAKGHFLQEVDYRTMEIRILACLTQDPALIKYVHKGDMHLDEGVKLFGGSKELISKEMRFHVKGGWSFAQVYGSFYVNCAKNLWAIIDKVKNTEGLTLREHIEHYLHITTLQKYTDHLEGLEQEFWNKYHVTKQWQTELLRFYDKHLYVEMPFGFRRGGLLSRNKIINTPVQGTAFHCLLWSLIELVENKISRGLRGFDSSIRFQIHDSLIMDVEPSEEEEANKIVRRVMCNDVREANPFIIVPLDIDIKKSKVGGSWYMKKEEGK